MLILPLAVYAALYLAAFWILRGLLKRWRERNRYASAWAVLLAVSSAWLLVLLAISGGRFIQIVAMTLSNPHEDPWAMKSIGLFVFFVAASPAPLALAAIAAPPVGPWWRRGFVRGIFAAEAVLLAGLHFLFRDVCQVVLRDQFGQPVSRAELTYFLDGRARRTSDESGRVRISFYRQIHRLDIVDAQAGGYEIDYRKSSHRPFESIPSEIVLPAWKILRAPQMLLMRPNLEIRTDGQPAYVNLLRQEAGSEPLPIVDLEIRVWGPAEPPPHALDQFHPPPFPWSVDIRCPQGGIQAAPEGYRYLAPPDHYQKSVRHDFSPDAKDWNSSFQQTFYLRLRGGKVFAVAEITVTSLLDAKRMLFIDAKINPAADRNLFWGYGNLLQPSQRATAEWLEALFGSGY